MVKCKKLREYSYFVDTVRKFSKNYDFSTAVDKAVDKCIKEEVLDDILKKYRAEVKSMLLTEFDEEREWKHIAEGFRELWFDEGVEKGKEEGIKSVVKNMVLKGKSKLEIIDLTGITNEEYEKLIN